MNKTVGSTLLVAGTMIGAGMLAMPLTSAGIGLTATVFLLLGLWAVLTFTKIAYCYPTYFFGFIGTRGFFFI